MHARRLACFLLGLWLAGGLFMAWVATQSFHEVDRLLSHTDPTAIVHYQPLGDDARPLMRFQASEFNRYLFRSWENVQLAFGLAFLVLLILFWTRENKLVLGGVLLLLALTAAERLVLSPAITTLGRAIDFAAATSNVRERNQFWIAHTVYAAVEVTKWLIALLLTARMVFSTKRSGRSRDARQKLDRVDKRDYGSVNG
jgi:hypothetical protein